MDWMRDPLLINRISIISAVNAKMYGGEYTGKREERGEQREGRGGGGGGE